MSSSTSSIDPGNHDSQLTESFSTARFLGVKASYHNFGLFSKSFNVNPCLFICLGQLRIIEYVQSQRTAKASNMESFATIVNE